MVNFEQPLLAYLESELWGEATVRMEPVYHFAPV